MPGARYRLRVALLQTVVCLLAALPAAWLAWRFFHDGLGANPLEAIEHGTGDWALRLLLATLAVTPLCRLAGWQMPLRLRRPLGLLTFAYAALHVLAYAWFDQLFDWRAMAHDLASRPFVTAGFVAFALLIPLAATSFDAAIRFLGGRRWRILHRAIHAIAILAVVHYWLLVKRDIREPLLYALILAGLFGIRLMLRFRRRAPG